MKDNYGRPLSPLITIPFWIIVAMLIIDAIGICQLIGQWVLHGMGK